MEGYAFTIQPLCNLLKKGEKFIWSDSTNTAFNTIKESIASAPALSPYVSGVECCLTVDASQIGLGAVLTQIIDKQEHTIAFGSRSLKPAESSYSTIEREALACSWAIEKFKTYLWGTRFHLFTDHKPLLYMLNGNGTRKASSRLVRLLSKMQEYNFNVQYISGMRNVRADCLSRMPIDDISGSDDQDNVECVVSYIENIFSNKCVISAQQ